ncbi:MAG: pilus assembly protein N-terminal domain-containing protein [Deltaproteobacteria bacterium]|nr:pilus assembly protein N-terminal domain-containing protein [Deltaproteobacteria bacterium]
MKRALAIALVLAPLAAHASPPHAVVEVRPGDVTFQKLFEVSAIASADPSIATVEQMPSGELLISGKKAGTTDIVAMAGGKVVGLRVHVRPLGAPLPGDGAAQLAAMQKACPTHRLVGDGADQQLGVTPSSKECRAALVALFATDRFMVKQISVDFDTASLQAQLAEIEEALQAAKLPVTLRYQGATLLLKGNLTQAQAGQLAVLIYSHVVGGAPLDDSELEIEAPDAGAPEAPAPHSAPVR